MALPSAVTIGSAAFVLAAAVGYGALSGATAPPAAASGSHQHAIHTPTLPPASKPIPTPQHASTPAKPRDIVPNVLVVVFNNTGIQGLAAEKAKVLEGAGWTVAATDNWYGDIPADTVYYPPRLHGAAIKLAAFLHIQRLRPAVAPMQFDRLTVILASG